MRLGDWLRVDLRARFQGDVRRSEVPTGEPESRSVDIARRRVGIDGRFRGLLDFQVERELHDDNPWRDVYVDYRQFEGVQVRVGKFKLPFSLDENASATDLDFVYRSRVASVLAPGRDRGVMVHGRLLSRTIEYEVGVFDRDGDNARSKSGKRVFGGRTTVGRVRARPFRSSKSAIADVEVGAAFTSSDVPEGFPDLRGRTALDASFFPSNLWVSGPRRRAGLEARWRPGPFSVQSEYIRVTDERHGQSVEDTDLSAFLTEGWYASATWAVTGESKSRGLDVPRRPVQRGGFGAIELAARLEKLSFGSEGRAGLPSTSPRADFVLGNSDRAVTIGVNWYLNRWVKIQGNVIREQIGDPTRGPLPDRASFWSRVVRFQLTI
ncbi:MAG: hypothetical protein HYZ58_00870 [Acidobacteria bacterium]|nr:hypothetical protein [Acidobacteriota bacterium]MBI3261685.1 hypothetical protein [Acidobacteriota bacterium]